MTSAVVGVVIPFAADLDATLNEELKTVGFDYIVSPLVDPSLAVRSHNPQFTRSDLLLYSSQWRSGVVGTISPWALAALSHAGSARAAEAVAQELAWAAHLGLIAVVLPLAWQNCAKTAHAALARVCLSTALRAPALTLLIAVPIVQPSLSAENKVFPLGDPRDHRDGDPWEHWNAVRLLCEQSAGLGVLLELVADLPDDIAAITSRWCSEPVKAIVLPSSIFLSNRHGYPVLPKAHQTIIDAFLPHGVQFIIKFDQPRGSIDASKGGARTYHEYVRHLVARLQDARRASDKEAFEAPYHDVLQAPLQPLQDNLESQTYETFEQDPVKYELYEQAMEAALREHPIKANDGPVVLMVVGAGRGPLVRAALRAAKTAERPIRVYAVEKNPHAIVTLQAQWNSSPEWQELVTVVQSDMRAWTAPEKADILVSELLGSFGDNESSPECLDGVQQHLRPGGISIPSAYTSFLAPLQSQRLYNNVEQLGPELKHAETPYVVALHNVHELAEPQACFTFDHPTPQPADNARHTSLTFHCKHGGTLHGFSGYFDATLYKSVHCSILPATHSDGMFSWFPIYFPLKVPYSVPPGSDVIIHMWRLVSDRRVWYEWAVSGLNFTSPIHNPNARSYYVGL